MKMPDDIHYLVCLHATAPSGTYGGPTVRCWVHEGKPRPISIQTSIIISELQLKILLDAREMPRDFCHVDKLFDRGLIAPKEPTRTSSTLFSRN